MFNFIVLITLCILPCVFSQDEPTVDVAILIDSSNAVAHAGSIKEVLEALENMTLGDVNLTADKLQWVADKCEHILPLIYRLVGARSTLDDEINATSADADNEVIRFQKTVGNAIDAQIEDIESDLQGLSAVQAVVKFDCLKGRLIRHKLRLAVKLLKKVFYPLRLPALQAVLTLLSTNLALTPLGDKFVNGTLTCSDLRSAGVWSPNIILSLLQGPSKAVGQAIVRLAHIKKIMDDHDDHVNQTEKIAQKTLAIRLDVNEVVDWTNFDAKCDRFIAGIVRKEYSPITSQFPTIKAALVDMLADHRKHISILARQLLKKYSTRKFTLDADFSADGVVTLSITADFDGVAGGIGNAGAPGTLGYNAQAVSRLIESLVKHYIRSHLAVEAFGPTDRNLITEAITAKRVTLKIRVITGPQGGPLDPTRFVARKIFDADVKVKLASDALAALSDNDRQSDPEFQAQRNPADPTSEAQQRTQEINNITNDANNKEAEVNQTATPPPSEGEDLNRASAYLGGRDSETPTGDGNTVKSRALQGLIAAKGAAPAIKRRVTYLKFRLEVTLTRHIIQCKVLSNRVNDALARLKNLTGPCVHPYNISEDHDIDEHVQIVANENISSSDADACAPRWKLYFRLVHLRKHLAHCLALKKKVNDSKADIEAFVDDLAAKADKLASAVADALASNLTNDDDVPTRKAKWTNATFKDKIQVCLSILSEGKLINHVVNTSEDAANKKFTVRVDANLDLGQGVTTLPPLTVTLSKLGSALQICIALATGSRPDKYIAEPATITPPTGVVSSKRMISADSSSLTMQQNLSTDPATGSAGSNGTNGGTTGSGQSGPTPSPTPGGNDPVKGGSPRVALPITLLCIVLSLFVKLFL